MDGKMNRNNYLDDNFERFVGYLKEWLAIPSISTLSEHGLSACQCMACGLGVTSILADPRSQDHDLVQWQR